jgi:sugar phosphate isomerase/epimerase
MLSRRLVLLAPAVPLIPRASGSRGKMTLSLHQTTSAGAGFRKSLEGWARAGIKNVEITAALLDEFLKTETIAAAGRLITDLGLTPVSGACGVGGLWEPTASRAASLDSLKKRCEQFAALGLGKIYAPTTTTAKFTLDDYKAGAQNMREVGEIVKQFRMTAMVEFVRSSSYISTLTTLLKMTREAGHANLRPMLDCYHFWSGLSKFEDLDLLRPGELAHVHFQDVPDMPRELLDSTTRLIPGDGISPLERILRKLAEKGYSGPLSVELFLPQFQQADPYELARRIRDKAGQVMRQAGESV